MKEVEQSYTRWPVLAVAESWYVPSHPVLVVYQVYILYACTYIILSPSPPSQVDWPTQSKLPNCNTFIMSSRIPRFKCIIDYTNKRISDRTILSSIDTILTPVRKATNMMNSCNVMTSKETIQKSSHLHLPTDCFYE